jgi:hypothetical protein
VGLAVPAPVRKNCHRNSLEPRRGKLNDAYHRR